MENGKLSERILKRSVLRQFHNDSGNNNTISAAVGNDCAFLCTKEGYETAVNTQTVCFGGSKAGFYAVMQAVNHIAASGAMPTAVTDAVILPAEADEPLLKEIVSGIREACDKVDAIMKEISENNSIKVICGHTEISSAVSVPIVSVTAFGDILCGDGSEGKELRQQGKSCEDGRKTLARIGENHMKPGQQIVMSKYIGLEGTAILAQRYRERLRSKLPVKMIDEAVGYEEMISVLPEAAGATKSGVCAMHALSQGGVFGALWEMAQASGTGLKIDLKAIPVKQETIEICEQLDINPYRLLSGGSLLISSDDGEALVRSLEDNGIPACIIGYATDGNDRVLTGTEDDACRYLEPVNPEELFRAL